VTRARRRIAGVATGALLLLAIIVTLFPVYWTVTTAFKTQRATFAVPPQLFPAEPTLQNFADVLARREFVSTLVTSIELTVASTALCLLVGGLAAYALARFRFPGSNLLQSAVLILRILPAITIIVPLYKIFATFGILDNLAAIIVVYATINLPFAIWLLASFMSQVPIVLEDAAQIDGASRLQLLYRVVLPLAAPGVIATSLFVAILAWNEFLVPVVLATTDAKPLSVFIAGFVGSRTIQWGELSAAASLAILPIIVFSIFVQRYLVTGLSLGALKE
jgi:multiple sugar transport system permease protein